MIIPDPRGEDQGKRISQKRPIERELESRYQGKSAVWAGTKNDKTGW